MQLKMNLIQNYKSHQRIEKLIAFGHDPSKMELVIVGGTFLFMPKDYQRDFIKSCYDAQNGIDSKTLEEAKSNNEHAEIEMLDLQLKLNQIIVKKTCRFDVNLWSYKS